MSVQPQRPTVSQPTTRRRQVRITGVVQGVGFRPFVYSLAGELGLVGHVSNTSAGVVAEVQGLPEDVEAFCRRVAADAPTLAVVHDVSWRALPPRPTRGFTIDASRQGTGRTLVPPDVATCPDCVRELLDPRDRRHRHPFISCTNCGPRFTIVTGLPYDRPATTMARFPLCHRCAAEYEDPGDRRFHAQPIACHDCGPTLELLTPGHDAGTRDVQRTREDALRHARTMLDAGGILAVKGLGGYHLACDATDPRAAGRLRERKRRGGKPFALLVRDLATAHRLCHIDDVEEALLRSARRPIVLLRRRRRPWGTPVAEEVAPGSADLGLMLPPTALHHLLLGLPDDPPGPEVLVLTSGNLSGEPIVTDDTDAMTRLGAVADAWLRHDRAIHVPCDDSVTRVVDGEELPLRRSRGYAPVPVALPFEVRPSLAAGGDLKNTLAVAEGRCAWLSAHVGDMEDLATQEAFARASSHLEELTGVRPEILVADAHPGYHATGCARRHTGLPPEVVQHHHAHVASVMAENGIPEDGAVIGVAFDGTGYGTDGTVWGGEVLVARYTGFQRFAHLSHVPLPGGDAAVQRPHRMALAHLHAAGIAWDTPPHTELPCVRATDPAERRVLLHQFRTGLGCVPTSSAGRLFDAVASLVGLCHVAGFEAQAAMALEAAAHTALHTDTEAYPLPLAGAGPPWVMDTGPLLRAAVSDVLAAVPAPVVAARFHRALATAVLDAALAARDSTGLDRVAVSGGVFCNAALLRLVSEALRTASFQVLRHHTVPPNDGGLALGQIAVAARTGRSPAVPDRPAAP